MELDRCLTCKRPFIKQRSTPQNKYYWSVVVGLLSEHTGFTREEMHEVLKRKFLSEIKMLPLKNKTWQEAEYSRSSTDLDTKSFEEFLCQVRVWASAELGVWIPSPNEAYEV